MTFRRYLADVLSDERYEWTSSHDPLQAFADETLIPKGDWERVLDGRDEPTNEQLAAMAGALDIAGAVNFDVNYLLELTGKTLENGDVAVENHG